MRSRTRSPPLGRAVPTTPGRLPRVTEETSSRSLALTTGGITLLGVLVSVGGG